MSKDTKNTKNVNKSCAMFGKDLDRLERKLFKERLDKFMSGVENSAPVKIEIYDAKGNDK